MVEGEDVGFWWWREKININTKFGHKKISILVSKDFILLKKFKLSVFSP
jgi:hypothetical protein